jgi:hypothetical protein
MAATIYLNPRNPRNIAPEELESFAADLRGSSPPGMEVRVLGGAEIAPGARGVTWWEVVDATLKGIPEDVRAHVVDAVLVAFVAWARRRFAKRPAQQAEDKRPKCIVIVIEGRGSMTFVLRSPDGELVDGETARNAAQPVDAEDRQ